MDVLAIIPARGGSKGIPGKNLRPLAGRPLIEHTYEAARGARSLSRVIVSTDSEEIAANARANGVEVPFLRPAAISGDSAPAKAYVSHCLEVLAARGEAPEAMAILQPTSPLRLPEDIDACVSLLAASGADAVVTVSEVPRHFHPGWQLARDAEGALRLYDGRPLSALAARRQDLPPTFFRDGAVYVFRVEAFRRTGSFYGTRTLSHCMPAERAVSIDDLDDWRRAEEILARRVGLHPDSERAPRPIL